MAGRISPQRVPRLQPNDQITTKVVAVTGRWALMLLLFVALSAACAYGQSSAPPADTNSPQSESQGESSQDDSTMSEQPPQNPDSDNAATSGESSEGRSFLQLGVHASEGMQTNPSGLLGYSSQYSSVTNVLGSARLREVKRHSTSALDYSGGGSLYAGYGSASFFQQQIQQLGASQSFASWRWRLILRDNLRYLSEGSFGTSSLNNTSLGASSGDAPADSGTSSVPSTPVAIGQDSYLVNDSGAEFVEALSRRSSVFAGGTYSLVNYFNTAQSLYNILQASGSGGYSYQLTQKDSVGALYQYQNFRYPSDAVGSVATNVIEFTYRRVVTGRMNLSANAGPEFTDVNSGKGEQTREIGFTATASVGYKWEKSNLNGFYSHQVAGGSGIFAGVNEDIAGALLDRTIHRYWNASVNGGYTLGRQIASALPGEKLGSFAFEFAGGTVRRQLGRNLSAFGTYDFAGQNFSNCAVSLGCEPVLRRHTVSAGIDWYFHPISLQ
jgi:hypothetical protein